MNTFKSINKLIRLCSILTIILLTSGQVLGSKTTWKAYIMGQPNGSTEWNLASNWDNGVPTAIDSAIITGGNANLNVIVFVASTAEALHVTVDQHCILNILSPGILLVIDSPTFGITIERNAELINNGIVTSASNFTGIVVLGLLENYGELNTNLTSNGISIFSNGIFTNLGDVEIRNSGHGLLCSQNSQVTNEPNADINILDCDRGLTTSELALFVNDGEVELSNMAIYGLYNGGRFVNNNKLKIKEVGPAFNALGIINEINAPNDLGAFENNLQILMFDIEGTAIQLRNSATFMNDGQIIIFDINEVTKNGLITKSQSNFTITKDGSLFLPLANKLPIDIELGSVLDVHEGGILSVAN